MHSFLIVLLSNILTTHTTLYHIRCPFSTVTVWYQPINHSCVVSNSTVVRSTTQPLTFEKKIKTGNGWVYSQPLNHNEADSIKAHYLTMSLLLPQNQTLLLGFSVVVWLTLHQTISYSKLPLKLFWLSGWSLSTDIREWSSLKGMARLLLNKLHCGWVVECPINQKCFWFSFWNDCGWMVDLKTVIIETSQLTHSSVVMLFQSEELP